MTTTGNEEQLAINVIAKLNDLEKQMAKASGITAKAFREMTLTTNKATRQMERDAARSAERINSAMATVGTRIGAVGRSFAAAAAAAFSTAKILEASQAYVRASNALKVAGISGDALTSSFDRLYQIAQANSTPLETLVGLYAKASQAQTSLGASSEQLFGFTTTTAQALRISGKSAEESSGALLQLGQALTSGTVHAEEYNSMLEGAYPILQAAAAGIKETGGEVSKLTTLVKDGQVSSKAFFYGVLAGAPTLTEKLAGSTKTAAQAWTQLWNAVIKVSGEVDNVTGGTTGLVSALDGLTGSLDRNAKGMAEWAGELKSNVLGVLGPVADAIKTIHGYMLQVQNLGIDAAKDLPQDVIDAFPEFKAMGLKSRVDHATGGGFGGEPEPDRGETRDRNRRSAYRRQFADVRPISLSDFPAEGKKKKGGGGESEDEFERAIRRSEEQVAALEVEASVVGKTTEEKAKATEAQRLLTAAKQADIELSPAVRDQIAAQAADYARATAEVERLEQAQRKATQAADDFRGATKDVMSGFISDLRQGKSGAEALANALNKVADKVADKLVSSLVDGMLGAPGAPAGGLLKSILALFGFADGGAFAGGVQAFAKGGAFTNSIVASPTLFKFAAGAGLMGEAGPEAIMPLRRDRNGRLGVTAAGGSAPAPGGSSTYSPTIHMQMPASSGDPGRDAAYAELLKRELRGMLDAHASEFLRRQMRPGGMMSGGVRA